ncbi:MAG TPA: T9SS type A sorting domain-containing protein [Bacteroidia bacterium]|nr:T9SS type A sorting domain-containing protein [Bacteroidia bacterium]
MGIKFNNFPLAANHSDEDEIYKFPLKYGNRDSTTFKVAFQLPLIGTFKQMGSRVNEVDGWGTITLPDGTTHQCLRVKSTIYEIDSVSITVPAPTELGFPSTRVEYKWLTNNDKVSVLQVTGTEIMGSFTPATIQYRSKAANNPPGPGMSVQEKETFEVIIYPNPATEKITLNLGNPDAVKLFDMQGKEITVNYTSSQTSTEITTSSLNAGFYMLLVKAGNELVWEKVEVK